MGTVKTSVSCPSLILSPPLPFFGLLQVQTNGDNTPVDALSAAIEDLSQEMESLQAVFQDQVAIAKQNIEQEQYGS